MARAKHYIDDLVALAASLGFKPVADGNAVYGPHGGYARAVQELKNDVDADRAAQFLFHCFEGTSPKTELFDTLSAVLFSESLDAAEREVSNIFGGSDPKVKQSIANAFSAISALNANDRNALRDAIGQLKDNKRTGMLAVVHALAERDPKVNKPPLPFPEATSPVKPGEGKPSARSENRLTILAGGPPGVRLAETMRALAPHFKLKLENFNVNSPALLQVNKPGNFLEAVGKSIQTTTDQPLTPSECRQHFFELWKNIFSWSKNTDLSEEQFTDIAIMGNPLLPKDAKYASLTDAQRAALISARDAVNAFRSVDKDKSFLDSVENAIHNKINDYKNEVAAQKNPSTVTAPAEGDVQGPQRKITTVLQSEDEKLQIEARKKEAEAKAKAEKEAKAKAEEEAKAKAKAKDKEHAERDTPPAPPSHANLLQETPPMKSTDPAFFALLDYFSKQLRDRSTDKSTQAHYRNAVLAAFLAGPLLKLLDADKADIDRAPANKALWDKVAKDFLAAVPAKDNDNHTYSKHLQALYEEFFNALKDNGLLKPGTTFKQLSEGDKGDIEGISYFAIVSRAAVKSLHPEVPEYKQLMERIGGLSNHEAVTPLINPLKKKLPTMTLSEIDALAGQIVDVYNNPKKQPDASHDISVPGGATPPTGPDTTTPPNPPLAADNRPRSDAPPLDVPTKKKSTARKVALGFAIGGGVILAVALAITVPFMFVGVAILCGLAALIYYAVVQPDISSKKKPAPTPANPQQPQLEQGVNQSRGQGQADDKYAALTDLATAINTMLASGNSSEDYLLNLVADHQQRLRSASGEITKDHINIFKQYMNGENARRHLQGRGLTIGQDGKPVLDIQLSDAFRQELNAARNAAAAPVQQANAKPQANNNFAVGIDEKERKKIENLPDDNAKLAEVKRLWDGSKAIKIIQNDVNTSDQLAAAFNNSFNSMGIKVEGGEVKLMTPEEKKAQLGRDAAAAGTGLLQKAPDTAPTQTPGGADTKPSLTSSPRKGSAGPSLYA